MGLTNAERQRRWRERHKAELKALRNSAVAQPEAATALVAGSLTVLAAAAAYGLAVADLVREVRDRSRL